MNKSLISILLFLIFKFTIGQIGISTPLFLGDDADLVAPNWGITLEMGSFIPKYIRAKDSTTKAIIVFQPSIKFEWLNFEENLIIERTNGVTTFQNDPDNFHKYDNGFFKTTSMMQTSSFFMPIEIWIRPKKLKGLLIAPGFYVDYILGGRFKNKYTNSNEEVKNITKYKSDPSFFGFNRFQYGPCGHISYKFFTIYGIYSLQPVFKSNQGIDINRFSIGIWVNFFYKKSSIKPY